MHTSYLLDGLLVLVQLLKVLDTHARDAVLLSNLAVLGVTQNADGHARLGDVWEPEGST